MDQEFANSKPEVLASIIQDSKFIGFDMASDAETGALLRVLAASKPGGQFLELGTGTGLSTAWILDGMDRASSLVSVDSDELALNIAKQNLTEDRRVRFIHVDAGKYLESRDGAKFDFIFADAWPGKFSHLDITINMLNNGGIYVVDDLIHRTTWPQGHAEHVKNFISAINENNRIQVLYLTWSSHIIIATKLGD